MATMQLIGSIFSNSLKRIAKFVNANILPGATSEVGLLCCACVHSYLVSYYPIDQYKPFTCQPGNIIKPWGCSKAHQGREVEMLNFCPKWHDPSQDELSCANELLQFHLQSALDDLLTICQTKLHSKTGDEKEHLKVTNTSSLQCMVLPEMRPSYKDERSKEVEPIYFIAGSAGSTVGSSEMREKSAEFVHIACRLWLTIYNGSWSLWRRSVGRYSRSASATRTSSRLTAPGSTSTLATTSNI
ncbi:proteasome activator subunit 4-like isoform X2 [Panicum virgatum]|uniref:proteasome activator subunit 4-like isoform X2 n=1 Tax=Panicum virgatum TaxID=38727 RepID=UPI0019D63098|nr:proteasome activator subunit 4-like isoform X2 [Panicum virgatum]